MWDYENKAKQKGYLRIAGIDEAGRGPLAGPVVCAACILPENFNLQGINDSKLISPKKREALYQEIIEFPGLVYSIISIDVSLIDEINIYQATLEGMRQASQTLSIQPDYLLIDGTALPNQPLPAEKIIKGDQKSVSIATASILAKVYRDNFMQEIDNKYPGYGFSRHKGYGTKAHLEALKKFGPTPVHRQSFEPVKTLNGF